MTTEEIHNFNIDNKDVEVAKCFAYFGSGINLNRDGSQEIKRRPRLGRTAREELGKVTKSKDVPLETNLRSHPYVPIHRYESWTMRKADKKKLLIHLKYGVGEEFCVSLTTKKTNK